MPKEYSHNQIEWSSRQMFERLENPCVSLEKFMSSVEGQFYSIGENLRRFHSGSRSISEKSSQVVNLLLGDDFTTTYSDLDQLILQISDYSKILEEESSGTILKLRHMVKLLDRAIEPVVGFKKIVKTMSILGLSTKIESANQFIIDDSFDILADDLKKLSVDVGRQSATILDQLEGLSTSVEAALSKVLELNAWQQHQSKRILANTQSNIRSVGEKNRIASEKARLISSHSRELTTAIGEVVSSIQFHDLSRQQVEHVTHAIRDLIKALKLRETEDGADSFSVNHFGNVISEVARLQSLQVKNTKNELVSAVERILFSLRDVSVNTTGMAAETREIAGASERDGSSFLSQMGESVSAIASSLEANISANQKSASIIHSIADNIDRMDEFLSGIEQIGAKMKILALNAGIQAAHADFGGAGLSVIAESVQQLSTAALLQTGVVSRVLREITIESKDLFSDASFMNNERHGDVKAQLSELNRLLDSLKLTNSSVVTTLQEIDTDSQQLASELDITIRSISIHDDSAEMLSLVCKSLDEIHSYAEKHSVDRRKDRDIDSVLKDLYSRYTMSSERDVHTLLSRGEEKSTNWQHSNDDAVSDDRENSEFGANVELF